MKELFTNDIYLKKVFARRIKRGIARYCCIMDYMSRPQKVKHTIKRLSEIPVKRARIIIQYWEDDNKMAKILKRHNIVYRVTREYKNGATPGLIDITISNEQINRKFFKELLSRHYGHDFSANNAIDIIQFVIIDAGGDEIIAFHLYDDRGFYEYYIPNALYQQSIRQR